MMPRVSELVAKLCQNDGRVFGSARKKWLRFERRAWQSAGMARLRVRRSHRPRKGKAPREHP
jgi:hypothetical protein